MSEGLAGALILTFGGLLSAHPALKASLLDDLLKAGLIAAMAILGSVVLTLLLIISLKPAPTSGQGVSPNPWPRVGCSFAVLFLGVWVGWLFPSTPFEAMVHPFLYAMIICVGILSAQQVVELRKNGQLGGRPSLGWLVLMILLPTMIMAGSLLFPYIAGMVWDGKGGLFSLCAAPMGWQTLGGPLVRDLQGERWGQIAFLTNMFRDVLALLIIPLISRKPWAWLALAPGGVSTMDILLPTVLASGGKPLMPQALWVGACCSVWAPILTFLSAKVLV